MKLRPGMLVAALLAAAVCRGSAAAPDQCVTCHEALDDAPSKLFKHDVHFKKGLSCADCHGGNPRSDDAETAMSKKEGFIGAPKGDEISKTCAACHADPEAMRKFGSQLPTNQWENLQASVHGKLSTTGKEHIVQCTTCHSAHGIVHVKDPSSPVSPLHVVETCTKCHANAALMRSYNPSMPVDQLDKYRTSVHGIRNAKGDPNTAECASCHGSHDIRSAKDVKSRVYATNIPATCAHCHSNAALMKAYRIPTDQFEKFSRSVHGVALLQKNDVGAPACNSCHGNHGAAPPGVESVSKVCGTCHALNADLFSSSPHKKAFDDRKLPECETCHGNHEIVAASDSLLGVAAGATCGRCHTEKESTKGFLAARSMRTLTDSLVNFEQHARTLIDEAEQKGMEVSEAKFRLRDVHQARMQSRTMVHAFNEDKFHDAIQKGLVVAAAVSQQGQQAIDEYYFRRFGLGFATIIITILASSLYLYIKRLERKQARSESDRSGS
ncbi:MAG TPA: ammonia-forming cytochrome c nitrite reductase subunit c552 [Bacteroidota bacterium]|nr:ammonia-forming cytochrome c nitrite reductase subunit c552 [Bacteroidota bacterium]